MQLDYVPLLQLQHDFYTLPRNFERFQTYLRTMTDPETDDLKLPLVAMNPMGKDHLLPHLAHLLTIDADGQGAQATADATAHLGEVPGTYGVTTIVCDDLLGGWTNRYSTEFWHCFATKAYDQRGWITALLWSSERYTPMAVYGEVARSIYRLAYIQQHGYAQTLGQMLAQEGYAMAQAGAIAPMLDAEDMAYTQEILQPYLAEQGEPILIAALFGDPAAHQLGYTPLGLSPYAGFALALYQGQQRREDKP